MVICISAEGRVAIVFQRTNRVTKYITTLKKKRKLVTDRSVDFDRYFRLYADDPQKAAIHWLSSPLRMTQEVRKRLEMIVSLNKFNKVVAKYEDGVDAPNVEGVSNISGPEDLAGRSVKSLTALYNRLISEDFEPVAQFASVEEATVSVWAAMEMFELPTKAEKTPKAEKAPKETKVLIELPKKIGKQSAITVLVENPKRGAAAGRFDAYVNGGTVAESLAAGVRGDDIRWDAARGFISIEFVEDAPKPVKEKKVKEEAPAE